MSANGIKIAFGGATWLFSPVEEVSQWLKLLEEAGIERIDTAELYGGSEETMGKAGAASKFTVDTKSPGGFIDKPCTKDIIVENCKASLRKLNTNSVSPKALVLDRPKAFRLMYIISTPQSVECL